MPDITMCSGEGCSLRESCWRFKAPPSMMQAYFTHPPVTKIGCEYHWVHSSLRPKKEKVKKEAQ